MPLLPRSISGVVYGKNRGLSIVCHRVRRALDVKLGKDDIEGGRRLMATMKCIYSSPSPP
ncbi:hypothetical protein IQ06DRAFT_294175 [Phaeosphaeriaceae sp. SRC1lsM3a]|nr:hypothetical protein IQ06DRAFT_294175 [Stagonospora sp. SRC1lsM3a]